MKSPRCYVRSRILCRRDVFTSSVSVDDPYPTLGAIVHCALPSGLLIWQTVSMKLLATGDASCVTNCRAAAARKASVLK